jgi:DNA-3-methyladenine glycosylase
MAKVMRPLARRRLLEDAIEVAPALLGVWLVREIAGQLVGGPIVETEAYLGEDDPGSHASRRRTAANDAMWAIGGTAYVYTIHTRCCLNVVTSPEGRAQAVLIRAIEPRLGLDVMRALRGRHAERDLCSGPGKLCQALAIGLRLNHHDLTAGDELFLARPGRGDAPAGAGDVAISVRVGLAPGKGEDLPLRFCLRGNSFLSRGARPASR